ncbi:XRE family transcriptional regulator [Xylophilus sp. GW821-FHT01B05]
MSAVPARLSSEVALGLRIRAIRTEKGWTLEQTGQASGLARSTLSKIENGQMSPTYDALIKLASGLQIDLGELFSSAQKQVGAGRRSISREGSGTPHATPYYQHVLLCNDLSNKDMVPFRTRVVARAYEDFDDWSRHVGEEFVYVLSGMVRLFTEFYEPADLGPGDSWYIDSRMGHRVISLSEADAEVLWLSTTHPKTTANIPSGVL